MPFTVWQCPKCGKRLGGACFCRCVIPSSRAERVETFSVEEIRERLLSSHARKVAFEALAKARKGRTYPSTQAIKAALDSQFPTPQDLPSSANRNRKD